MKHARPYLDVYIKNKARQRENIFGFVKFELQYI